MMLSLHTQVSWQWAVGTWTWIYSLFVFCSNVNDDFLYVIFKTYFVVTGLMSLVHCNVVCVICCVAVCSDCLFIGGEIFKM